MVVRTSLAALLCLSCKDEPSQDKSETPDGAPEDSGDPPDTDTDTGSTPDETGDTGDDTPPVPYFEPYYVHFATYFGFDPLAGEARWYWGAENTISPQIVGMLFESSFLFTGDYALDACGFVIVDADTTSALQSEPWLVDLGGTPGEHLGFVMPEGTFVVGDYSDPETGMGPCSAQLFDPALYGSSFAVWAYNRRWGMGIGELHPETRDRLLSDPDFSDLRELLEAGLLVGASVQTDDGDDDPGVRDASLVMVGYPMDATGVFNAEASLTAEQMWPETLLPAQGVYTGFLPTWIRTDTLFVP